MTPFELSVQFFLQLVVILGVCRLVSMGAARLGQPPVVGEMIAGVLLGPSLFGLFFPQWQAALFPAASKPILFAGAQVGLALYMFVVGLEFRVDLVRARIASAAAISLSGIVVPFALGCALAVWLWRDGRFFNEGITLSAAAPYLGAAMAITAFPMLARIIVERKLTHTTAGALALAAGAIDDAAAWCVLAVVLAGLSGDMKLALYAVGGGIIFVGFLLTIGKPLLRAIAARAERSAEDRRTMIGVMLALLMAAAWFTDKIGLYAVFGAFFLGAAVPRGRFCDKLAETIEPLTTLLFLPLFFIYSGLNTRMDVVAASGSLIFVTLAVLAAAVLGKAGACYVAARLRGESHRESMGIGMLMNARGLMELIILNIGLERGLITPALFSIMVVMAIVTTLMCTPLFNLTYGRPTAEALDAPPSPIRMGEHPK
jgi:Kef-type K+ transport system membrane component KefB